MNLEELIKAAEAQERNGNAKRNFNIGTVNAWFPVFVNLRILRDAKRRNRQRRLAKVKANWKLAASIYRNIGKGVAKKGKQLARKYYGRDLCYLFEFYNHWTRKVIDCDGMISALRWYAQEVQNEP